MFADRYFGKRYFPNRYFPTAAASQAINHPVGSDGGFYRRPIKYVRDGKVVDINEPPPVVIEEIEWPELTPAILNALLAGVQAPPIMLPDVAALERQLGRMVIDREAEAMRDDDDAVCLLLLA
ncbi:MAG: hypothetical protein EOR60_15260 [Mesorhizobium sp.]|nr:MAG: hypothetical protein EOR60_15260 [Mesorhizobium sp.]